MSTYDATGPNSELAAVGGALAYLLLLFRSSFLLIVQKDVIILTDELRDIPILLKVENPLGRQGFCIRFGIIHRDLIKQVVVIHPPDALYNVQAVRVRMTFTIDPCFVVKTACVDDECISLPFANRVSHP